jgi:hypothetical protein
MGKKVVWCVERRVLVEFMNAIKNVLETSWKCNILSFLFYFSRENRTFEPFQDFEWYKFFNLYTSIYFNKL